MYTSNTTYATALDTFLLPYAKSLILYANTDAMFAESLAAILQQLPLIKKTAINIDDLSTNFITLNDQAEATEVATWLYNQLTTSPTRTLTTSAALQTWASDFESPKDQIFGVVGIAIIGPTLGLISKKKKRLSHLQVVINNNVYESLSKTKLNEFTQKVGMEVIAKEIRLVGGNVYNLHPDTAKWCLDESKTKIFTDDATNIKELAEAAKNEGLSHSVTINEAGKVVAIALSPSVNDSFVDESEAEVHS